jgi:uncharacterized protein (DUF697 family)
MRENQSISASSKQLKSNTETDSPQTPSFLASIVKLPKAVVNNAFNLGKAASRQTYHWLGRSTESAGRVAKFIGNIPFLQNPIVQKVAGVLKLDWLVGMSDRVDLIKAENAVKQLQQKYPNESSAQIAHRIMVEKATYASGIGFVSSILPGFATALLAIDLAATTALQTEMVYEIAAAYGLNLQDSARKGEVLAIFGLALGGNNALKAGLGFIRNVPLAGATIAAGTNATMLYSLGYAASRFYEAKLRESTAEPSTETLKVLQQESEQYLDIAIAQQAIVDRILVHIILASYPDKTLEDILRDLEALKIAPESRDVIAANLRSPEPLEILLEQLNRDFAIPLLVRGRQIAQSNGEISSQETKVLEAIAEKFALNIDTSV